MAKGAQRILRVFDIRGGGEKWRKVRNAFCEFYIRGGGEKWRKVRNAFCEFYIRGGDEKCRKVVGKRPVVVRVSNPGPSGYHSGYVDINAAPRIKFCPRPAPSSSYHFCSVLEIIN
jgi:hypothetical protein